MYWDSIESIVKSGENYVNNFESFNPWAQYISFI